MNSFSFSSSSASSNKQENNVAPAPKPPALGPEPTLVSRKEMDVLYHLLGSVKAALEALQIEYIVTGGSLLGAVRQASILFCDDDVDISILDPYYHDADPAKSVYHTRLRPHLAQQLGPDYQYQHSWEGGDRVYWKHSNVFLDIFVICKYENMADLERVLAFKANGHAQSPEYVARLTNEVQTAAQHVGSGNKGLQIDNNNTLDEPFWHFGQRKAVELWPREVYRDWEMWPLTKTLQMGPHSGIPGPRLPVLLLQRAFGDDCFEVYYPSLQHGGGGSNGKPETDSSSLPANAAKKTTSTTITAHLPPKVLPGGTWQHATKTPLTDQHFLPIQPTLKANRRANPHCRQVLREYLQAQTALEQEIVQQMLTTMAAAATTSAINNNKMSRPRRTVYMDGVFDLFHVGHLAAIRQCAIRGDRVIIGLTGDADATGYKRKPIISQDERATIVSALDEVDEVVCPCPLVVTEEFMKIHGIDMVVHGFVNDNDALRQASFFEYPMSVGKFERIPYYKGQSTTNIMRTIQAAPPIIDDG